MILGLVLSLLAAVPAQALTCKEIDSYEEGFHEYFTDVKQKSPRKGTKYHTALLRKSVAAFYPLDYSKKLTDEEVDDLGEGVSVYVVKGKDGKEYQAVNVGFGGGNSAVYLYERGTLNLVPVAFEDGDCSEQGDLETFPIEKEVKNPKVVSTTCVTDDPKSPVTDFTVRIPLAEGDVAYKPNSQIRYTLREGFVEKLKAQTVEVEDKDTSFSLPNKSKNWAWSVGTIFTHELADPQWDIQFHVNNRSGGKTAKISGRATLNITGGHWDERAFDFKANMTCDQKIQIRDRKFQRVIEY